MKAKIEINVFQHPILPEAEILYKKDTEQKLFDKCAELYQSMAPEKVYPHAEVEARFSGLLKTVAFEKSIQIIIFEKDIEWETILAKLEKNYPQLVWVQVKKVEGNSQEHIYSLEFIPLAINTDGFPFSINLVQSLIQQNIPAETDPIDEWVQELYIIVESGLIAQEHLSKVEQVPTEDYTDTIPIFKKKEFYSGAVVDKSKKREQRLREENDFLKTERKTLLQNNQRLEKKITELRIQVATETTNRQLPSDTSELSKQALYYEEALKRERDAKERMKLSKEKLEHLVNRLERQIMESSLDILEGEVPYVNRKDDWHKKCHIDLIEYDQLYQKAKYLEHTWKVNQQLIVISERMTIGENELKYERERVNKIKNSSKDIELFVMMDECRMINERVKIRKGFLGLKPRVTILNGDYENLVEKAAYFDVIQSENQFLERIIEERQSTADKKIVTDITD